VPVGITEWRLHLPGCHSLKEKRSALKPLLSRLRQRCNVSVAETGRQDAWQEAEIACAAIGGDRRVIEETLRMADRLVDEADGIRVMDTATVYQ
jgi:uncharacterized protein YlxP (DUF503 family)